MSYYSFITNNKFIYILMSWPWEWGKRRIKWSAFFTFQVSYESLCTFLKATTYNLALSAKIWSIIQTTNSFSSAVNMHCKSPASCTIHGNRKRFPGNVETQDQDKTVCTDYQVKSSRKDGQKERASQCKQLAAADKWRENEEEEEPTCASEPRTA